MSSWLEDIANAGKATQVNGKSAFNQGGGIYSSTGVAPSSTYNSYTQKPNLAGTGIKDDWPYESYHGPNITQEQYRTGDLTEGGVKTRLLGYVPGQQGIRDDLRQRAQDAGNRQLPWDFNKAPQTQLVNGEQIDTAGSDALRGQQMSLADAMRAQSAGPSIAQLQYNRGADQNMQAALSQASNAGPRGNAALMGAIGNQRADQMGNIGAQAGQARMQEQLGLQGQLGDVLGSGRRQDMQGAINQGQLNQQAELSNMGALNKTKLETAIANQDAQMRQREMNDAMVRNYTQQGLSFDEASLRARMDAEALHVNEYNGYRNIENAANGIAAGRTSGELSAAGALLPFLGKFL